MDEGKRRWPLAEALVVAETLRECLAVHADRCEIAGSIRRRRQDVGDIELVYVPRFEGRPVDLLRVTPVNVTEECIARLEACGQLSRRLNKRGVGSWGRQNKLAVHVPTGIPVDLFAIDLGSWHNYMVCRTGPAESNQRIALAAQRKGWKWNPYGRGFERYRSVLSEAVTGEEHVVESEREVFEFVGLPYLEAWER